MVGLYALVGVVGLFVTGTDANMLTRNMVDDFLQVVCRSGGPSPGRFRRQKATA